MPLQTTGPGPVVGVNRGKKQEARRTWPSKWHLAFKASALKNRCRTRTSRNRDTKVELNNSSIHAIHQPRSPSPITTTEAVMNTSPLALIRTTLRARDPLAASLVRQTRSRSFGTTSFAREEQSGSTPRNAIKDAERALARANKLSKMAGMSTGIRQDQPLQGPLPGSSINRQCVQADRPGRANLTRQTSPSYHH